MEIGRIVVPEFEMLVQRERKFQDNKWGVQNHTPEKWFVILVEEFGEMATEILHSPNNVNEEIYLERELVQIAAVCQAMWESGKRQGWL